MWSQGSNFARAKGKFALKKCKFAPKIKKRGAKNAPKYLLCCLLIILVQSNAWQQIENIFFILFFIHGPSTYLDLSYNSIGKKSHETDASKTTCHELQASSHLTCRILPHPRRLPVFLINKDGSLCNQTGNISCTSRKTASSTTTSTTSRESEHNLWTTTQH